MDVLRVAKFANEVNIRRERVDQTEANVKQEDINYSPPSSSGRRKSGRESSPEGETYRERKFLGPYNKVDNEVSVHCRTSNGNTEEENLMLKMGLPIKFTSESENAKSHYVEEGTIRERGRRGEKKTYFCEICLIELNSWDTMNSHIKGIRHMKKKLSISQQMEEAAKKGEPLPRVSPRVIQIPNPEPLKKKVPRRLHEKIQETMEPAVGLEFIEEFRAVSDIEMEPHYECRICQKQGQSNGIYMHIMGSEHRQKFVDHKFENDPNYMDLSQSDLLNMATKYRENSRNLSDVIKTYNSDEHYPWPPGKAPWSLEMGGTGVVPDNARENYGKVKKERYEEKHFKQNYGSQSPEVKRERKLRKQNEFRQSLEETISLPETIESPSCIKEAEKYLEFGSKMLNLVLDSDWLSGKELRTCKANLASIVNITADQIEKEKYEESHNDKKRRSKGDCSNQFRSNSPTSPETSSSFGSSKSNSRFGSLQRSLEANHRRKRSRSHSRSSSPSSSKNHGRKNWKKMLIL